MRNLPKVTIPAGAGLLFLLWAAGRGSSPSSAAPGLPGTATAKPNIWPEPKLTDEAADDSDLKDLGKISGYDLLWARYVRDPDRPGPRLPPEDAAPVTRRLNDFERWALKPWFPVALDLQGYVLNGKNPPLPEKERQFLPFILAKTDDKGDIWLPNDVRPLWQRRWLAVIAHELVHRAQLRMGSTPAEAIDSIHKHGYWDAPQEVQARYIQRRVLRGLAQRAQAFYDRPPPEGPPPPPPPPQAA